MMKFRPVFAFFLMLVLIVAAVALGAYRGWSNEYAAVQEMSGSINRMLASRVETANNILSVAARHLPAKDEDVASLRVDLDYLRGDFALSQKATANRHLTEDALIVLEKLRGLESVKNDKRDLMYAQTLLPQMLSESGELTAQNEYNRAARSFNERLSGSPLSGKLARLFGVHFADVFDDGQ